MLPVIGSSSDAHFGSCTASSQIHESHHSTCRNSSEYVIFMHYTYSGNRAIMLALLNRPPIEKKKQFDEGERAEYEVLITVIPYKY